MSNAENRVLNDALAKLGYPERKLIDFTAIREVISNAFFVGSLVGRGEAIFPEAVVVATENARMKTALRSIKLKAEEAIIGGWRGEIHALAKLGLGE